MSKVEITKTLISASAKGCVKEERIPVNPKSNGPSTFKHLHPFSHGTFGGTLSSGHTTDSSSVVFVIEKKEVS